MTLTLLHRRLFRELVFLFCLCLGSLLSLILVGRVLQLRELFMSLGLGLVDLARLFMFLSPFFLVLLIPVACMLAVFLAFLRMSTDRELLALKAGGVSLWQMVPAPALLSLLCAAATLVASLWGLGWGMGRFRATIVDFARTKAEVVLQSGVFNMQFPGLMLYARNVDNTQGLLEDVIVEDHGRTATTVTILAPMGRIVTEPERGRVLIALDHGRIYQREKTRISVLSFDRYQVRLDLTNLLRGFDVEVVKPKEMSWNRIKALLGKPGTGQGEEGMEAEEAAQFRRKLAVEAHKRWVFPAACLVLPLFAMPLACFFEGLKRQYGVLLAMGLFLVYYSLLSLGLSLGETGLLPPAVGLWLPNVAFLVLGLWGLRVTARERGLHIVDRVRHLARGLARGRERGVRREP